MSNLRIRNKALCTPPTLVSVVRSGSGAGTLLTITWNVNNMNYSSGSLIVEMSVNGGVSYIFLENLDPTATGISINANQQPLSGIPDGTQVTFRLVGNNLQCSNMLSNTETIVWKKPTIPNYNRTVPYACQGRGDGPTNFDVTCEGKDRFTMLEITGIDAQYRMKTSGDTSYFGLTRQGGATISNGENITANELLFCLAMQSETGYPGTWPWGQYIPLPDVVYLLEYSTNNGLSWNEFTVTFQD
ncbi:hypothetical protein J2810_004632 [Chryseobacterium rhizosphaerae]|uniref:hypothetical protein n=1 Tax=Chryseobacterium rhizosphaerae TaxID=395937 RepID=UPI00285D105C|nr:hypothetical protein [Chryseobacterium rhizosphaerae]MDR6548542.1 hypothetical protein [Chryseobacterium rhizosphaerae]